MTSIPASEIVSVTPGVLAAGGSPLSLNGLLLTQGSRVPIPTVQPFSSLTAVSDYFGAASAEYIWAQKYFAGFDNSQIKPGSLLVAQYPAAAVAGYLRGGRVSGLTLAQLQAISGILTITTDGTPKTTGTINLAAATSFSNAATIINTALAGPAVCSYDAQAGAFVFTSPTTGAASTVSFGSGTIANPLKLQQTNGAVVSAGAVAGVPGTNLAAIAATTQNWATFSTLWEPVTADCVLFAEWCNSKNNRFLYVFDDTDATPTVVPDTTSAGALMKAEGLSGYLPVYEPSLANYSAFVMGSIASIDFSQTDGRATLAFRSQSGLAAAVTDQTIAANLLANGYNFYGAYATANDQFQFFYNGQIGGPFLWADTYVDQIKLNSDLQLALMELMISARSIPYNASGYGRIQAACADPINEALNSGIIRAGITLSALQISEVNAAAGIIISDTLQQIGWYLQIKDATPQVRAARASPPCTLWYTDGGSVQKIALSSVTVQ